jgi:phosphate transport system substrate-binding protein
MFTSLRRARGLLIGAAAIALLAGACGGADPAPGGAGDGDLSGSFALDGSSTVFPIAQAVAEDFQLEHPDVEVAVGFAGTSGGFEAFCAGDIEIVNASRPIDPEEEKCLRKAGIEYTEFQIGVDGLAVVTHPSSDWVDCITIDQLRTIYEPSSEVSAWNEVDPSWPDEKIALFGPDPDSGTYDYFAEEVADPDADEPATRDDMTQSADDNVLVQGVQGEEGSIGYFGYAYYAENAETLKALEVDDGESGCVAASPETVKSNEYSLSRPLFFYVSDEAMNQRAVTEFVSFWIANSDDFATTVGYVEVPEEVSAANEEALDRLAG